MAAADGDGNDVETVHALAADAVSRACKGGGPTLLEFATYRLMEHCGPNGDLDLDYRSAEEFTAWQARDPVATYRNRLTSDGTLAAGTHERVAAEIARELDDAVAFAKASPFPTPDQLARFLYPETGR